MKSEEKNSSIFTAYDDEFPFDSAISEKELLLAILLCALSDFKKGGATKRRAVEFLLNPLDDYIFSFQSICDYLCMDPNTILERLGLKAQIPAYDLTANRYRRTC